MTLTVVTQTFQSLPIGTSFDFVHAENTLTPGPWIKTRKRKFAGSVGGFMHTLPSPMVLVMVKETK